MVVATKVICPLCLHEESSLFRMGVREDPLRSVYTCANCDLRFIEPPERDQYAYYREQYRLDHGNSTTQPYSAEANFQLMRPLMEMRAALFKQRIPKGAKVLEVGCSSGYFLDAIKDDYTVYGNEWNPEDAAYVRDVLHLPCSEERLEDAFLGEKFTAICAFQVFEHVARPLEWLRLVKSRLIGGGWIYLEVPNVDDALVSMYDMPDFASRYFREPHISYFNMHNLAAALGIMGFEARVTQTQRYSLFNHLNWLITGKPQDDAAVAWNALKPLPDNHPAADMVNRLYARFDREYRVMLDVLKCQDTLIGAGAKREI